MAVLIVLVLVPTFNLFGSGEALSRLAGLGRRTEPVAETPAPAPTPAPNRAPSPTPNPTPNPAPNPAPTPAPVNSNSCQVGNAAAYFPYHQGTKATYTGVGNEYAAYKLDVIHESGNKVEWRKDNGGTVVAEVFQVAPQQVTRIYREGEAYDQSPRLSNPPNASDVILQGPIQVGAQWTAGSTTYTIQSVNATVQALNNQALTCVVKVKVQDPNSITEAYYHQQYGLVLSIFNPGPNQVESRLATFQP